MAFLRGLGVLCLCQVCLLLDLVRCIVHFPHRSKLLRSHVSLYVSVNQWREVFCLPSDLRIEPEDVPVMGDARLLELGVPHARALMAEKVPTGLHLVLRVGNV